MSVPVVPARRTGWARLGPIGPPLLLLAVMWALELVDVVLRGRLDGEGIVARNPDGLLGVLLAPFLHVGFAHLMSNSVPLLVMGTLVAYGDRGRFWPVTGAIVVLGGFGTWLIAPSASVTIGASGLVFGYLAYLLVVGVRTRHWWDLFVGVVVLLTYGTLLLGALPWVVPANVSWQAHLCGALAGGLAAWRLPPRPSARRW
ncbi:MAG: rhomboid family intramembrane serine protease [Candidatus Nanopelagicales bacterium]|jgi:membrane associated rhomboid family serine protease|nr:rhomboid family intramembrane serine protease [Candidatus Nanopelagicales bacterium]